MIFILTALYWPYSGNILNSKFSPYMSEINITPDLSFISAGFPSPADDFTELSISLDKHLIQSPAATFMAYANGNSMIRVGIHHGDILIIDRSLNARNGDIVIAVLHGEFTVKQISIMNDTVFLVPRNPQYTPVQISSEMDFYIWGVVSCSIRKHR